MDHLNALSDNELRQRLLQYGFPNIPITKHTRKVLIKKLRNHIDSEQAKLKQATSYVTRYSSDEDTSDHETKRQQRATMPPPKTNKKSMNPPPITKISPRSQSVYVSPVVRHINTDSEDDTDVGHATTTSTSSLNSSFSNAHGSSPNNRSYTRGRTSTLIYPTTSTSFTRGFDRSYNTSLTQSRDHTTTSNGHGDDLSYRRSALDTSSRTYFCFFI